jgi:hypothetical protein
MNAGRVGRILLAALLFIAILGFGVGGVAGAATTSRLVPSYGYDALATNALARPCAPPQLEASGRHPSAPVVAARRSARAGVATEAESAAGGIETTAHGATRIAGESATRGGVLTEAEIAVVRGGGTAYSQTNGAIARVLEQANGRFSVVVDGDRGLITTFQNLSQSSLERLAKNYGWTPL